MCKCTIVCAHECVCAMWLRVSISVDEGMCVYLCVDQYKCVCVCVRVSVSVCVCVFCMSERKCGKYGMNQSLEEIRMNGTVKSMICYL